MMRKLLLCSIVFVLLAGGCAKDEQECRADYDPCSFVAPASEIQAVQSYLAANNLTAVQHCSGVFYIIDAPGTGAAPDICSMINTNYVGKLTNGQVFDSGTFQENIQLGGLIRGWVNTLPLIKKGGKIRMFIPPSLGYGNREVGTPPNTIPANSILIFDIELTVVQ
ncbi:MAG TPA: FKBP-type peptidyl-prolyl cis-trans isomerase [Flavisolibacter sp.]